MKLTAEQRAALDALPPKRRAFVLAYVGEAQGNATDAARRAGYAKPHPEGSRLLRFATVAAAVDALRTPAEQASIASVQELREMWAAIARGEVDDVAIVSGAVAHVPASLAARMKASELLGKSQGAFLERVEHSGQAAAVVVAFASPEEASRWAKGSGSGGER